MSFRYRVHLLENANHSPNEADRLLAVAIPYNKGLLHFQTSLIWKTKFIFNTVGGELYLIDLDALGHLNRI